MNYGLTINTQTDQPMTLHDVECDTFKAATKNRRITEEEAGEWLREHSTSKHKACIKDNELPPGLGDRDGEVVHIIWPSSKAQQLKEGKRVKAICGSFVTRTPDPNKPVCRKCFDSHFEL